MTDKTMKTLVLERSELVWQTRKTTWEEEDYLNYLDYLRKFKDTKWLWQKDLYAVYEVLSKYTWEDICRIWAEGEEKEPTVKLYRDDGTFRCEVSAFDYIRDEMREQNYASDVIDENYADDYNENWRLTK